MKISPSPGGTFLNYNPDYWGNPLPHPGGQMLRMNNFWFPTPYRSITFLPTFEDEISYLWIAKLLFYTQTEVKNLTFSQIFRKYTRKVYLNIFEKSYFSERKSYFAIFNVKNLTESDKIWLDGKYVDGLKLAYT